MIKRINRFKRQRVLFSAFSLLNGHLRVQIHWVQQRAVDGYEDLREVIKCFTNVYKTHTTLHFTRIFFFFFTLHVNLVKVNFENNNEHAKYLNRS